MGLKVEDEYYSLVLEDYRKQVDKVEQSIEDFKGQCELLFTNNNFGIYLQEVMQEIYLNFYDCVKEQLSTLMIEAQTIEDEFMNDIVSDDKL